MSTDLEKVTITLQGRVIGRNGQKVEAFGGPRFIEFFKTGNMSEAINRECSNVEREYHERPFAYSIGSGRKTSDNASMAPIQFYRKIE